MYGDKQERDVARFFSLDPMTTVLAFRQANAGAITDGYDELLRIIKTFLFSTAECERGFKALNDVYKKAQSHLLGHMQCHFVSQYYGPPPSRVEYSKYAHEWLQNHLATISQN